MLNRLLDAIYSDVISASISGMKIRGADSSAVRITTAKSAAWLPGLIATLNSVTALPAPREADIEACRAQLAVRSAPAQPTLH